MLRIIKNWMFCHKGVTAVEYGILVGGVALALAVVMVTLGVDIASIMEALSLGNQELLDDFAEE